MAGLAALGAIGALLALGSGQGASVPQARTGSGALSVAAPPSAKAAARAYGRLPLRFEANRGQSAHQVRYIARGAGYTLFLTPREAVLSLARPVGRSHVPPRRGAARRHPQKVISSVLRMRLLGAEAHPRVAGVDRLAGSTNYL
ncbi:MAG: hypothetical protein LC713_00300, partial [Actinobacteria bacterium]|nr:hypothetical protein [Actinomycetota bacterium]